MVNKKREMKVNLFIAFVIFVAVACSRNEGRFNVEIPDFNFPQTVIFEENLAAYNIFTGIPSQLIPSDYYELLELNSILFTDYAYKQRLVKIPEGSKMTRLSDGDIDFPDGSILAKTFYYYKDERETSLGKRVIETRLLIKEDNIWNAATYIWNEQQMDASLLLDGYDTTISWINEEGNSISTLYLVPDENECITCHQSNETIVPLGVKLRNLNKLVTKDGDLVNQISYLQSIGKVNEFQISEVSKIVDYKNTDNSLTERARAYLDLNCAHCHNPGAWEETVEAEFDFRWETPFNKTGILVEREEILEALNEEEMPFLGTSIIDTEGVALISEFINNL